MDRKAMYKLSYGLFVCTAVRGEKINGCIINTAIQVASEPNTISIAVNKANYTHDMVMKSMKCNISVISETADFELFKQILEWSDGGIGSNSDSDIRKIFI